MCLPLRLRRRRGGERIQSRAWDMAWRARGGMCRRHWVCRRASGDGMLQIVENLDVDIVGRAVESEQFAKAPVVIVFVGEFEDWFAV